VRDIRPETREQRDWAKRIMNVQGKTPSRPQSRARGALQEIRNESKLLTSYSLPAEHWKHVRTTNPIEWGFVTVRLRQRVTEGPGFRIPGLTMAYQLLRMAQERWRSLDGATPCP
jgi:putative transposase